MSIVLSHSGKQHSYQVAKALKQLGQLDKFYTSSYVRNELLQNYFLKTNNSFWTRRFVEGLGGDLVNSNWRFEIKEILLRKLQGKSFSVQLAVYERDVNFDGMVAKELKKRNQAFAFWGFLGSCLESLHATNSLGYLSICEMGMAHITEAKKIFDEERVIMPLWAEGINHFRFPASYEQRLREEPHVAQRVIAASKFSKRTLVNDGVDKSKIELLPLGFELEHIKFKQFQSIKVTDRPLKLLFAGTITQAKGVAYLLEAVKAFPSKDIELHFIGGIQGEGQEFKKYKSLYHYKPPVALSVLFHH